MIEAVRVEVAKERQAVRDGMRIFGVMLAGLFFFMRAVFAFGHFLIGQCRGRQIGTFILFILMVCARGWWGGRYENAVIAG